MGALIVATAKRGHTHVVVDHAALAVVKIGAAAIARRSPARLLFQSLYGRSWHAFRLRLVPVGRHSATAVGCGVSVCVCRVLTRAHSQSQGELHSLVFWVVGCGAGRRKGQCCGELPQLVGGHRRPCPTASSVMRASRLPRCSAPSTSSLDRV